MTTHRAILVWVWFAALSFIPQHLGRTQAAISESNAGVKPELPFSVGERIVFEIRWKPPTWLFFIPSIHAGNLTLQVEAVDHEVDPKILLLSAVAESSGKFASLARMKVLNRYESRLDIGSFCSRQFIFKQREGKRSNDIEINFYPEEGHLHIRKWDMSKDPPLETHNQYIEELPPCTQDLLSILYTARRYPMSVGKRLPVVLTNDRGKTQEIKLYAEKLESVKTKIGAFSTYKIKVEGLFGGLFRSGGNFKIWLEKEKKIPVRFESKVKFGRVFGKITEYRSEQNLAPATPDSSITLPASGPSAGGVIKSGTPFRRLFSIKEPRMGTNVDGAEELQL